MTDMTMTRVRLARRSALATTALAVVLLAAGQAGAADYIWRKDAASGEYFDGNNWEPSGVPWSDDTAIFGESSQTTITVFPGDVGGWTFDAEATDYVINLERSGSFTFHGAGIDIQGGSVIINNYMDLLQFSGNSGAGAATITNFNDFYFWDSSSADTATINNHFDLDFRGNSSAGAAIINNHSGLEFWDSSIADAATINNYRELTFRHNSFAGNATITNYDELNFSDSSSGGNARIINLDGEAIVRIDLLSSAGTTFGSIEGGGRFVLGGKNLTVGGNGLDTEVSGTISGDGGSLTKVGTGTLVLSSNDNSYTGTTTMAEGTLLVNGSIASSSGVTVQSGAVLGGAGTVAGTVIEAGGTLSPGASAGAMGTLTVAGDLTLADGSTLDFGFGTPGTSAAPGESDSVHVAGDLTLQGTQLNVSDAGGFGPGLYRLFEYEGTLTEANGGIVLGTVPAGVLPSALTVQRVTDEKHIDLVSAAGLTLNFWNANGLASPTQRGGGTGTWSNDAFVWTDADGLVTAPMTPRPGFAIFAGEAGTVTVDDADGAVSALGMQFAADGYRVEGDALTLVADADHPAPVEVRVGDGGAGSEDWVATIENELAGTDGLRKTGAGTLVLAGANSYTGGTTLAGGVVSVSSDANLGDASGALTFSGGVLRVTGDAFTSSTRSIVWGANGGGFDIADAGNTFTVSQALGGDGSLRKQGAGTLVLAGANGYTGGTLVEAGTLVGDAGSIRGDIANAARVVFDQEADATHEGDIAGLSGTSGEMVKQGAGTLTLAGTSSLAWSVEEGGLASGAERFTGDLAIASGASFTFEQGVDAVYAGTLSGAGSLLKRGSGALAYDGDGSSFTGTTMVAEGALIVGSDEAHADAVLGGAVEILSGATLGGHGTVGSVILGAGATVAPGNSIGTLHVAGDFTFAAGSVYAVEVDPEGTESDLIHATGTAHLNDASVIHIGEVGSYRPTATYTIVTADAGLDGTFGSVSSDFAFLDPTLSYDANNVYLQLIRNDIAFCMAGLTANQCATGTGVETTGPGNPVYNVVVGLSAAEAAAAFDRLSGEVHASLKGMLIEDSRFVRDAATERLRAAFAAVGADAVPVLAYGPEGAGRALASADTLAPAAWGRAFGAWSELDGDGNAASLSWSTGGLLAGLDGAVADDVRLGLVAGYSRSSFDVDARASSGSSQNWHVGLYGGGQWDVAGGALALRGGAAYSWHDIETARQVAFPGFSEHLTGDYHAATAQVFGEIAYGFKAGAFGFEPFANLAWVSLDTDGFTEEGGAAALTSASTSTDVTFSTLGLRAATGFSLGGVKATARAMVGWRHAAGDTRALSRFALAGSDSFAIAGTPIAEDAALLEAGIDFDLSPTATLGISYQGQFASNTSQNAVKATLNVRF